MFRMYTDGACRPNPGQGGWAYIIINPDNTETIASGSEADTTNNRMELTAVLKGLEFFSQNNKSEPLTIVSDSQYLLSGIESWSKSWRRNHWIKADGKPVLNSDLWKRIRELADSITLYFEKVKGHSGEEMNERVDKIASNQIELKVRHDRSL